MDILSLTKEAKIYNGEKTISSTSSAGKTCQPRVKVKLEHFLTPYTKMNSNFFLRSKRKTRNYKTPRKEQRQNTL